VDHSIYEVPLALVEQGMDKIVADRLSLPVGKPRITDWIEVIDSIKHPEQKVRIAIVGKYMKIQDAYKSIFESLAHSGIHHKTKVELVRIEAETLENRGSLSALEGVHGILV